MALQRSAGNRAVAERLGAIAPAPVGAIPSLTRAVSLHAALQRDTVTTTPPTDPVRREFVEDLIRFFDAATRFYAAKGQAQEAAPALGLPAPPAEATLREIGNVLPRWKTAYDNGKQIIDSSLQGDAALGNRLRGSYEGALQALHRLGRNAPRVNVVLVAAPGRDDDQFIANAAAYARTYFGRPATAGDTVVVVEGIDTLERMLSTIESAQPERMVRRVDVFAHGTIEPSNQLKLAGRWHTAAQLEAALAARRLTSEYLQSATRFDSGSTLEFHGCRLGAGGGEEFLRAAGRAVGGDRGQQAVGYTQRWFPRRYQVNWRGTNVADTAADVYGDRALPIRAGRGSERQRTLNRDRFIADFERHAVHLFDEVVAGSAELRSFATPQEVAAGQFARARKVEIMRAMYDANGAWLLGFLHPAHRVPDLDPTQAVGRDDYTFTREQAAWNDRTLRLPIGP
ncbi:hypothetical protein [Agromyces sp. M3QZ16-3]|uniref:hypothetical protein n=1 Tax=Agromyces sp. M3QZ16-3 TaxID=3447585 RepID=UPI003F68FF68